MSLDSQASQKYMHRRRAALDNPTLSCFRHLEPSGCPPPGVREPRMDDWLVLGDGRDDPEEQKAARAPTTAPTNCSAHPGPDSATVLPSSDIAFVTGAWHNLPDRRYASAGKERGFGQGTCLVPRRGLCCPISETMEMEKRVHMLGLGRQGCSEPLSRFNLRKRVIRATPLPCRLRSRTGKGGVQRDRAGHVVASDADLAPLKRFPLLCVVFRRVSGVSSGEDKQHSDGNQDRPHFTLASRLPSAGSDSFSPFICHT